MAGWLSWLEAIAPYVEVGGELASGIAGNRAAGRQLENLTTQRSDTQALNTYSQEQLARLGAARLGEEATQDRADRYLTAGRERAGQAGFGDALANLQDVQIDMPAGIPRFNITGGLRPSVFGPNARAAGRTLSRDALQAMLSGADVPNLPDLSGIGTKAPEPTPLAEAGTLDTLLGYAGLAGGAAGTVREIQEQRQRERERQEAANRRPLPSVFPAGVTALGTVDPTLPSYQPPAGNDYRVNSLELMARLKAEEDAARFRGGN